MREENYHDLEFVRPLSLSETFGFWHDSEGSSQHWLDVARSRGFETWEEWRRTYFAPFRMEERTWNLFRVVNPLLTVPLFRGGPFQGWIEQTYGDTGMTPEFRVIAKRLTAAQDAYVAKLKASFPRTTTIIGVLTDNGVVMVEGMHRCCALGQASAEGLRIDTDLHIALGDYLPGGVPLIPKVFKNTTSI